MIIGGLGTVEPGIMSNHKLGSEKKKQIKEEKLWIMPEGKGTCRRRKKWR